METRVVESLLQLQTLLHLRGKLSGHCMQAPPRSRQGPARTLQGMAQVMRSERQQPCQEGQQADVRGQLRCRKPAVMRAHRNLQVAAGDSRHVARRQPDSAADGILERIRTGADEGTRTRAARLHLPDLEVIALLGQARRMTVDHQVVQIGVGNRPAGRRSAVEGRADGDEPLAPQSHGAEDRSCRSRAH